MLGRYDVADLLYFSSGLTIGVSVAILLYLPRYGSVYRQEVTSDHLGNGVDNTGNGWGEAEKMQEAEDAMIQNEDGTFIMQDLTKKVKLLIWVKTSRLTIHDQATTIKNTWGKRADKLLFISSAPNATLSVIGLPVKEGWNYDAELTIEGFRYMYENHLDDADWFMQVDDDTFVIVENLLYFLSEEDPGDSVYYGVQNHTLPDGQRVACVAGGYLLSRQALKRFGRNSTVCRVTEGKEKGQAEAVGFNVCMDRLGIELGPTVDAMGRSRFHCLDPEAYLQGSNVGRFRHSNFDPALAEKQMKTVSDYSITFHGLKPSRMKWMYYYVYHLAPYGLSPELKHLNQ